MDYRPEIDGLRALAVIPVILFHAGFDLFGGGFVGVDVFFVISGYLITTILIEDLHNNRFSIVDFYERRARRILPALFFVILMCLPFAWMWMLPSQLKEFSQSIFAVSLFSSNILFWNRNSEYFTPLAEENPLLHTWSLAVEEQFYVLFPILLLLTWRFGRNRVFWLILILSALSLALSEWGWRNEATANFYLAPTRAWELLAGSLAAFLVQKRGVQSNDILSLSGLGAIGVAIFTFDETTPFPSVFALLPVTGTVLLVIFASKDTIAAKILSTKILVSIGLISYSAYLWHQPLFAFTRIRLFEEPSPLLFTILILLTFCLAWFSWYFIEKPFRNKKSTSRKLIFSTSLAGITGLCIIGLTGHLTRGFPERLQTEELHFDIMTDHQGRCFRRDRDYCNQDDDREKIVVIGDSTIHPLAAVLDEIQSEFAVVPITQASCIPVEGFNLYDHNKPGFQKNCSKERTEEILRYLESENPAIVIYGGMFNKILTGYWRQKDGSQEIWQKNYVAAEEKINLRTGVRNTVLRIQNASQKVFLLEFPEFGIDAQALLLKSELYANDQHLNIQFSADLLKDWHADGRSLLQTLAYNQNITAIDPLPLLCDSHSFCSPLVDQRQMYSDRIHPSVYFAEKIAKQIINSING